MAPWWQDMLAPFDLESTGIDTRSARIVSWCTGVTHPDSRAKAPHIETEIVNPGVEIPQGAIDVHGITNEMAGKTGNPPTESLDRLASWLAEMIDAKIPVAPFNGAYDFALLHWECLRHGIPTVPERTGGRLMPVIDSRVLDKRVSHRRGHRKLADHQGKPGVASTYGIRLDDAHNAVADALAAVDVARVIGSRFPEVGGVSATMLHVLQVDWYAEQCAGLQHYFRTEAGRPDAYVDPCWPVCLDLTHPTT